MTKPKTKEDHPFARQMDASIVPVDEAGKPTAPAKKWTLPAKHPLSAPFEVVPVPLDIFLYDPAFLNQPDLSAVQYEAVRHLETIYLPETEAFLCEELGWEPVRHINFAAIQWGKGSGKDHICGIVLARWVYRLQCLYSPQEYFGKAPQSTIHFLNIASSAGQASRAFFDAFRELVKRAPVFAGRYGTVQGSEPGRYDIKFDKQVLAISGHSGSSSQEGLNLLGSIADEISEFRTKAESERAVRKSNREASNTADSVIKMMKTSGRTRFPQSFKNAYISFPRFMDDAIQQLTARGNLDNDRKGERSKWYVSGPKATWDVNPTVTSKDLFMDDYEEDPAMAEAMYECKPGRATNRAFRNDNAISAAFSTRFQKPPLTLSYRWGEDTGPEEEVDAPASGKGWQVEYEYNDLWPYQGALYALHADMATLGDRAGVAMAHVQNWDSGTWKGVHGDVSELRPIVKLDFVISYEADSGLQPVAREVQIRWFRKLVWELSTRGFAIGRATLDGFQSTDSIQILESRGIESDLLSCDRLNTPVWKTLKDVMYDGRLRAYYDEEVIHELSTLRTLSNGKVDHPDGGTKDLADAVAGAIFGAVSIGGAGEGEKPLRADLETIDMFGSNVFPEGLPGGMRDLTMERIDMTPPRL